MQAPRLTDVLARVVAWHNRHPLARRIQPHQVHSIGEVRLPFAATRAPATPWLDTPGDGGPGPTLAEALAQRAAAAPASALDADTAAQVADDGRATTLALSADEAAALFAPSEQAASRIEDALADELAGALNGPTADTATDTATDITTDAATGDAPPAANDAAPTTTVDDAADLFGAAADAAPEPAAQAEPDAQAEPEAQAEPGPDDASDAHSSDSTAEAPPPDPEDLADAAPELELGTEDLPPPATADAAAPPEAAADGVPSDAPSSADSTDDGAGTSADDNAPTADAAAPSALAAALAARRPAAAPGADTPPPSDTAHATASPAAPTDAAATAGEHAATTAAAPVASAAAADTAAPAAAAPGLSALGRLRTLFSERFLWPVSPWRIARWAQRHGQLAPLAPADWPHRTVQTDPTLLAASRQKGLAHTVQLHVLTAGIGVGDRRLRLLIGADGAVLGRRAYSPLRMALASAVLLAAVAGASWPLWHRTHAAAEADSEAADAAVAAASAASDSASSAAPEAAAPASDAAAHGHDAPASAADDGHAAAPAAPPASAAAATDAHGAAPAASEPEASEASASQPTVFRLKRARTQRASEPLALIRPRLSDDEKQAAREASAMARGDKPAPAAVVYAVVTRAATSRAASEAGLAAMRAAGGKLLPPVPDHMEVLPMGNQWRAAWWPFTSLADADRVRVMLIGRGVQAEVIEF